MVRTLKAPLPFLHSAPTVGYPFTHAILISYFAPPPTFPGVGRRGAGNVSSISPPSQQPIYPGRFSFPPTTDLRPGLGRDGPSPGGGSRLPLRTGGSLYATIGEYDFLLPALRFMATEAEGDFPPRRRQIKAFSLRATTNMYFCSKSRRVRSESFVKKRQRYLLEIFFFLSPMLWSFPSRMYVIQMEKSTDLFHHCLLLHVLRDLHTRGVRGPPKTPLDM